MSQPNTLFRPPRVAHGLHALGCCSCLGISSHLYVLALAFMRQLPPDVEHSVPYDAEREMSVNTKHFEKLDMIVLELKATQYRRKTARHSGAVTHFSHRKSDGGRRLPCVRL